MEIEDILFEANIQTLKKIFHDICKEYETNPEYHLERTYENGRLVGFWVYRDDKDGYRNLLEGHYLGNNPFMAIRMYKKMTHGIDRVRAKVQKVNERVWKTYLKIGFKIVNEDLGNYLLQRGE